MALLDFDIEYTLRSSVRLCVPDSLKELDENQLRRLIMDISKSIVKNIDKDKAAISKGGIKITSKPEFVDGAENNTKLGLNKLPELTLGIYPYKEVVENIKKKEFSNENN